MDLKLFVLAQLYCLNNLKEMFVDAKNKSEEIRNEFEDVQFIQSESEGTSKKRAHAEAVAHLPQRLNSGGNSTKTGARWVK